ncbi:HigA family addiction module antitoxin [uncultured Bilophila sp.]|uniref:HigA family addiction module antitoxin n=1 Tax=uncultured Bilophila sp. TaxID=529385 RepID=UPI00259A43EF|nr:HigA family addiction module antitoxin [uncultured Bilophila sp.]
MRVRTHPGEILLEEFLKPMDITPHALAIALGVPATRIADIVHQRRAVTADTAARLSRYFGTTPDFWLNLQSAYDISVIERDKAVELMRITPRHSGQASSYASA